MNEIGKRAHLLKHSCSRCVIGIFDKSKIPMIPKKCRIGDTCFISLATIGGNLYTRHVNNFNNVQINSKDLLGDNNIGNRC